MTVSGTSAFNPSVTFLISEAYRDLDVIGDDEQPTAAQFNTAFFKLNSFVKTLEATGIHVWTEEEAIVFLQPYQARYTLGSSGANAQAPSADQWIQAKLNTSLSAGASVIPLVTALGITAGDDIGIVLDNGVTFWTTVSGAPSGANVTLAAPLPSSASAGAVALDYPPAAQIVRPLKIPAARLLTFASNQETPMTILARQGYMDLPNKQSPGVPTQWFYTPQRDLGYLYVWPVPVTSAWAVRFTWYRPLMDLNTPANTMDFPQEWVTPLRWLLANELMVGHSVPPMRQQTIKSNAAEWMQVVSGWDKESEPVQFGMDWQYR